MSLMGTEAPASALISAIRLGVPMVTLKRYSDVTRNRNQLLHLRQTGKANSENIK